MDWKLKWFVTVSTVFIFLFGLTPVNADQQNRPKLVLEIVVDQLRGDMPAAFWFGG